MKILLEKQVNGRSRQITSTVEKILIVERKLNRQNDETYARSTAGKYSVVERLPPDVGYGVIRLSYSSVISLHLCEEEVKTCHLLQMLHSREGCEALYQF